MTDPNSKDRNYLTNDVCPDCKAIIVRRFINGEEKQVCTHCNVYFELWQCGCVVRNMDADKYYLQEEEEMANYYESLFDITN